MMDYKDPEKVLEICEKATPGPWDRIKRIDQRLYLGTAKKPIADVCNLYWAESEANLEFVSIARTALPYYVERCRRLEAEAAVARKHFVDIATMVEALEEHVLHTFESHKRSLAENYRDDAQRATLAAVMNVTADIGKRLSKIALAAERALSPSAGRAMLDRVQRLEAVAAAARKVASVKFCQITYEDQENIIALEDALAALEGGAE